MESNAIDIFQSEAPEILLSLHHKTHKNNDITFNNLNYLLPLYTDKSDYIVVMKGTQLRISEWLVQKAIWKAMRGRAVFYVLPTWELKNRFVHDRFDRSLMYTDYYQSMIKSGDSKQAESASLKHIKQGSISFVGSNTANAFISTPADVLVIDELDNCEQTNLLMAKERLGASDHPETIKVGNPTISNFGISDEYNKSDQKEWWIRCSNCNELIKPDFFTHVIKQIGEGSYIIDTDWDKQSDNLNPICEHCFKPFDRLAPGKWIKKNERSNISGYTASKMISPTSSLKELVYNYEQGLANDSAMQRFYNSDLGLPYIARGSKITTDLIEQCISDYTMPESSSQITVMGADVGKVIHVIILELLQSGRKRLVYSGHVDNEIDVKYLWQQYNCKLGVIDALPESRLSKKLCSDLVGMFMCQYQNKVKDTIDTRMKLLRVDRTQALDAVKECFFKKEIELPKNIKSIPEFCDHLQASTRVLNEKTGNYDWIESSPDHLAHAFSYALKAEKLLNMI